MNLGFIKLGESILKEIFETLLRNARTVFLRTCNRDILESLKNDGISVKPNELSPEDCRLFIKEIDRLLELPTINVWQDDEGSDQRIYFAESLSSDFQRVFHNERTLRILREYTGIKKPVGFVLASRITYKEANRGSGGGWHRDSPYTHQFKSIYFLNDVNTENGPFQYIPGSHSKLSVFKSYFSKIFKPGQYRFSEAEVSQYEKILKRDAKAYTCDAGTLVYADTKGIHRGKPLRSGKRYAIFCYYWDKEIPPHFHPLQQNAKSK